MACGHRRAWYLPEDYGGLGLSILDAALVLEEMAKCCYVTAMATLGEAGVQTRVIASCAPKSIQERILPEAVRGVRPRFAPALGFRPSSATTLRLAR